MFHMLEKEHAEEVDKKADEQYRKRCNEVLAHSKVLYKTRQEAMETGSLSTDEKPLWPDNEEEMARICGLR